MTCNPINTSQNGSAHKRLASRNALVWSMINNISRTMGTTTYQNNVKCINLIFLQIFIKHLLYAKYY